MGDFGAFEYLSPEVEIFDFEVVAACCCGGVHALWCVFVVCGRFWGVCGFYLIVFVNFFLEWDFFVGVFGWVLGYCREAHKLF